MKPNSKFSRPALVVLLALMVSCSGASAALADNKKPRGVSSSLVVNAKPKHIWDAIQGLRNQPGSGVKQLEKDDKHAVLEEDFNGLPFIGKATCKYQEEYDPYNRIDYHLLQSDKFKAYEGAWEITPAGEATQNTVQLRTYIDTGLRLPFIRQITDGSTKSGILKRLQDVKKAAETAQAGEHSQK